MESMTVRTRRVVHHTLALALCAMLGGAGSSASAAAPKFQARFLAGAKADFQHEDAKLNAGYGALQAKLRPEARKALIQSHSAWVTFRDLECAYQTEVWAQTDKAL